MLLVLRKKPVISIARPVFIFLMSHVRYSVSSRLPQVRAILSQLGLIGLLCFLHSLRAKVERHATSYSSSEAVAVYEPNRSQLGSIMAGLFHDKVVAYVFTLIDIKQGLDSLAVSFARKCGYHFWSQLSRLDLVDSKKRTKMLCCGHIHKTTQVRSKNIGLSIDISISSLSNNLSFVLHILGTVGLLPSTALEPFMQLGMVLPSAGASDTPIKGITSTKTTVSYILSWKDYRSINSTLVACPGSRKALSNC